MIGRSGKIVLRGLVGLGLLYLVAYGARLPIGAAPEEGLIRLGWRTVGKKVELCRDYTASERRTLPRHMQAARHCRHTLLPYRLTASVNGRQWVEKVIKPAGARGDRPLYVNEDVSLAPGAYRLSVQFVPEAVSSDERSAWSAIEREGWNEALAKAPRYDLQREVRIRKGRIVLVDIDELTHRFVLLGEKK